MALWAGIVVAMPLVGVGSLGLEGTDSKGFVDTARTAAADHSGNLALVVIEDGKIAAQQAWSVGRPVSGDTLFQMASVSKWVTAWGVMTLVEAGRVDLDAPVSRYLTRWTLPPAAYPADQVTVRRLLSHTAGLTDDLGYCGFAPGQPLQTLEASLTEAADACPLRTGAVRANDPAGQWRYSGGGYTLLQLLIEEVSGEPFAAYMERAVMRPLGMTRATFRAGAQGAGDVAQFFDSDGGAAPHNRYTAAAAASLYASANDMARFALAHLPGPDGEAPGRGVLSPATLEAMRAPAARKFGTPHWGLGPMLYAASTSGGFIVGHDGGNVPAVNTTVRIEPATGDAIVALSTGGRNIAARLGSEWTRVRRAAITPAMVHSAAMRLFYPGTALTAWGWMAGGWAAIAALALLWRRRRGMKTAPAAA
jgi:CubicO group peptidase (beta-lactamase class C family)